MDTAMNRGVKVARPKLPEWRRRDYELRIKLDRLERLFLAEQCSREGESLSEYVRRLINREIGKMPRVGLVDAHGDPERDEFGEPETISYREALKLRASRMSAEELEARISDLLDFSEYEDGDE